jgi:hypothetical protein
MYVAQVQYKDRMIKNEIHHVYMYVLCTSLRCSTKWRHNMALHYVHSSHVVNQFVLHLTRRTRGNVGVMPGRNMKRDQSAEYEYNG